ncbi:MAG: UPF0182 family protein [Candidatus Latescibacterota bacterium]
MRAKKAIGIVIGLIVLLIAAAAMLTGVYTDWLWFASLGFTSVFRTIVLAKIGMGLLFGLIFLGLLTLNARIVRKAGRWAPQFPTVQPAEDAPVIDFSSLVRIGPVLRGLGILVLSALMGATATPAWRLVLRWLNQTDFGKTDPVFHRDIAFYVFSLPLHQFIQRWGLFALILSGIVTAVLYFRKKGIQIGPQSIFVAPRVKAHLSAILAAIFVLIAWLFRLKMFALLYSARGVTFGANYTDVHVQRIGYWVLLVFALGGAVALLANVRAKGWKLPAWTVSGMIAMTILFGAVLPGVVQQYVVKPNEITKERPYIEHNIEFTRMAYGLDRITEKDFLSAGALTMEDLARNAGTIDNIRLWDHRPVLQTYKQLQEMRLYYEFGQVDVDRYILNGQETQVMIAPREIAIGRLAQQAQTWVNQRLKYTHGYGFCMSPVNEVTPEGLPVFVVQDIPPKTSVDLTIDRPEIYYGEQTGMYVIVNTLEQEFDYPKGDDNVYSTYQGTGGVKIGSFFRRLAFAWRFSDAKILLTGYITPESRIMFHRAINQRYRKVAPFLRYDEDPYLVTADGKLYWIQDAYTTTSMIPYSEPTRISPTERINYIRNSVKAIIDAYTGEMRFYIIDEQDPLIATYRKIFPDLFRPFEEMPASLKAHIRYPVDLFMLQAQMYNTYHMRDPKVFYNQEDVWSIPNEIYGETEQRMLAYYIIMRLPEENREEFLLMLPMTPTKKNNMVAWMSAKCSLDEYGKLLIYKLPKEKLIYGPMQIEAQINQKPDISREFTLWGQAGSSVIRGNLLVIPIEQSFIYVEPIYLQSTEGQIPQLKRVIVSYENRLAMAETLELALREVFGEEMKVSAGAVAAAEKAQGAPKETTSGAVKDLPRSAMEHYSRAQDHLKNGQWAKYGAEMEALRKVLEELSGKRP